MSAPRPRSPSSEPPAGRASPLTQTAEYALRAMAHVATQTPSVPVRAATLAEVTRVPLPYLQKVLRRLVEAGLLTSQKGHGGGFVLARSAARIRFADVLEAVDGLPERNRCAFGWGECDKAHPCPLHPAWSRLDGSLRQWAESTTLADLSPAPIRLGRKRP